ncbi:type VI secretion system baseplate subunit TssK [Candidatus Uabimicrobium amorphum]|uniref:Type VI secretion system-associated protein n=1 Tax=Uabimicrobium amorphum TaxID=2596890 RepID=A0A5S9IU52_UABAM|nr:type VI secretion system baseplate subunit TssK [Candidatus Uabimicrobium amorphum]BBM86665.1 hypothetical protein UABAM_05051 [Candidatus Uabimicrobium amorphum]
MTDQYEQPLLSKIPRLYWETGQSLLPQHLIAQEESLLADMAYRFQLTGLPFYGLSQLEWNEEFLKKGLLRLEKICAIFFHSGYLVRIPGNSKIVNEQKALELTGKVVHVYLNLWPPSRDEKSARNYQVMPQNDCFPERSQIPRVLFNLEISPEEQRETVDCMKIAVLEKDVDNIWSLDHGYIPPLLQLRKEFLPGVINKLELQIQKLRPQLIESIELSYFNSEKRIAARHCLFDTYRLANFLQNMSNIHPHPFYLYEMLRNFYFNVCIYLNKIQPINYDNLLYEHDDLYNCLHRILDPLYELLSDKELRPYTHKFERKGDLMIIEPLPKALYYTKEVYISFYKRNVQDKLPMEGFRLASKQRLPRMCKFSLPGVSLKKKDLNSLRAPFDQEVEIFELSIGEEWDHVLAENSIAFYYEPLFEGVTAFLYWR